MFPQGGSVKRVRPTDSPADRKVGTPTTNNNYNNKAHDNNSDPLQLPLPSCEASYSGPSFPTFAAKSYWVLRGEPSYPALRGSRVGESALGWSATLLAENTYRLHQLPSARGLSGPHYPPGNCIPHICGSITSPLLGRHHSTVNNREG